MGTTYFVAASGGSDANSGLDAQHPFATISHGCIVAFPGDVIKCLTGTYNSSLYINRSNMRQGTSVSNITLMSITPRAAMLAPLAAPATGGGNRSLLECRCDWWTIDGFEASASRGYSVSGGVYTWNLGGAGDPRTGIFYSGYGGTIQNCKIYALCLIDPAGSGGSGAQSEGFYTDSFTPVGVSGWTSAKYQKTRVTIRFNEVHDCASANTTNKAHAIYLSTGGSIVEGNLAYRQFGGVGIHGWHGFTSATYINNTVFNCDVGILGGQGDAGLGAGVRNMKVFNNIVRDCPTQGYRIEGAVDNTGAPSNIFSHNDNWNNGANYVFDNNGGNASTAVAGLVVDPKFVNYLVNGGAALNCELSATSAMRDAGIRSLSGRNAPTIDIIGNVRPDTLNQVWDIGAYEFPTTNGDVTPPVFVSAVVEDATPNLITITMNEAIDSNQTPNPSSFAVSGGKTVLNAVVSGSTIILSISSAYGHGDVITVQYMKPVTLPWIQDLSGNATANFGPNTVTNNIATSQVGSPGVPIFGGRERRIVFRSR